MLPPAMGRATAVDGMRSGLLRSTSALRSHAEASTRPVRRPRRTRPWRAFYGSRVSLWRRRRIRRKACRQAGRRGTRTRCPSVPASPAAFGDWRTTRTSTPGSRSRVHEDLDAVRLEQGAEAVPIVVAVAYGVDGVLHDLLSYRLRESGRLDAPSRVACIVTERLTERCTRAPIREGV